MYASLQLTKTTLSIPETNALCEAIMRVACGTTMSGIIDALGVGWFDPNSSIVTDVEAHRWTRAGNTVTSPCAAPNEAKTKHVSFDSTSANNVRMTWGNGITSLVDTMTKDSSVKSRITIVVTQRFIFVGNYCDNASKTAGSFMLCSEFAVTGTASHYADANLLPVMSTKNTIAELISGNSPTVDAMIRLFNAYGNANSIVNTLTAGYVLNDYAYTGGAWNVTRNLQRSSQFGTDGVNDALLPIGINYQGSSTAPSFAASLTDITGIFYFQGIGTNTTKELYPDDTLRVANTDYIMFNKLAIPLL